jgi:hypothetical protein
MGGAVHSRIKTNEELEALRAEGRRTGNQFGAFIVLVVIGAVLLSAVLQIQSIYAVDRWPKSLRPLAFTPMTVTIVLACFAILYSLTKHGRKIKLMAPTHKAIYAFDRARSMYQKWKLKRDSKYLFQARKELAKAHSSLHELPDFVEFEKQVKNEATETGP